MDILIRLRVLLWVMVLGLWGIMIYQFLGEEERADENMKWVSYRVAEDAEEDVPDDQDNVRIPASELFPAKTADDLLTEPSGAIMGQGTAGKLARIPASLNDPAVSAMPRTALPPQPPGPVWGTGPRPVGAAPAANGEDDDSSRVVGAAPERPSSRRPAAAEEGEAPTPRRPPAAAPESAPPKGFSRTQTPHFTVYAEGKKPSLEFLETLENLHGNLMLDLAAFSSWARDERVAVYLFRDQESYRRVTGRPSWSGGATSIKRRKIYLYETDELVGILAHELSHIYFDSFFVDGRSNPLWLSEGMATLIQTERGLAAPNWLNSNIAAIRSGGGYPLDKLMTFETTTNFTDEDIRLWYAESYSVVRFLIRSQYRSSFYKFCKNLRDGMPLDQSLYRAYGMPFTRIKALEYAWRYDLQPRKS